MRVFSLDMKQNDESGLNVLKHTTKIKTPIFF